MDIHAQNREFYQRAAENHKKDLRHQQTLDRLDSNQEAVVLSFKKLIEYMQGSVTKTEISNWLTEISTPDVLEVVKSVDELKKEIADNHLDITPLVEQLEKMTAELEKVPKTHQELPEQREEVKVSNLSEISFKPLIDAINKLELVAEAPNVNVEPNVQVDAPDLKPLQNAMKEIVDAVNNIEIPELPTIPEVDLKEVEKQLKKQTKQLQELIEKPIGGGGGGGGNGTPYQDETGAFKYVELNPDGSIPVSSVPADPTQSYSLIQFDDVGPAYEYYAYMDDASNWYIKRLTTSTNLFEFVVGSSPYGTAWTNRAGQTYVSKGDAF